MTAITVEAIERLTRDERAAVIDLWTEVYSQRPYIPGCVETAAQTRTIMAAIFDYGLQLEAAELHGIREGGRLVCTSLRADTSDSPSLMTLTRFVARVTARLGWRTVQAFRVAEGAKPRFQGRNVELLNLATAVCAQGRGYGRQLMRFSYTASERAGFDGMVLFVEGETPAHRLYTSEGFREEGEFVSGGLVHHWMRRPYP